MAADFQKELLSSLVSDIKNYSGSDPLRPWLHGVRRMKESLPSHILKEKLPRFLQKCAQTFESDRKYRNDSRYLRVWIELMDYVDDAKVILRRMERNQIGLKRSMFYSAYALYYEKQKKFEEAEKMYHLGVQNLAEPVGELQKSYEKFLHRLMLYKKRKAKEAVTNKGRPTSKYIHQGSNISEQKGTEEIRDLTPSNYHMVIPDRTSQQSLSNTNPADHHELVENINLMEGSSNCTGFTNFKDEFPVSTNVKSIPEYQGNTADSDRQTPFCSDETVVVKFVDSAIVGKSYAEDACHHGLVDPTINMKEAMNAISSMFREPLEPEPVVKRSHRSTPKVNQQSSEFEVYIDESSEDGPDLCHQNPKRDQNCAKKPPNLQTRKHHKPFSSDTSKKSMKAELQKPFFGAFKILADDDDDDDDECDDKNDEGNNRYLEESEQPALSLNASVFLNPDRLNFGSCDNLNMISSGLKEDTVIRRFVGSTVLGEPEVENACHHGLVDPTINLKEAMDEINSMFGKPINFVRGEKPKKKQGNVSLNQKPANHGFSILADDDLEESKGKGSTSISSNFGKECDLFEPTIFTKEAMDEINEMFGKPLDF
ncbi:uncharacterized protein LOC103718818 isoform X2 [Phoenix dactylifera]|uniref:Uncharacterized protein LOC103718818 isoform X2 n=1 Tax=Phoenix dactylifera TaxID=42345 RepID=A0A8B8JAV6_PHODC|nr:uncharacterized protein LOC103718818 isoform X2 [Phoenix dactylifera]